MRSRRGRGAAGRGCDRGCRCNNDGGGGSGKTRFDGGIVHEDRGSIGAVRHALRRIRGCVAAGRIGTRSVFGSARMGRSRRRPGSEGDDEDAKAGDECDASKRDLPKSRLPRRRTWKPNGTSHPYRPTGDAFCRSSASAPRIAKSGHRGRRRVGDAARQDAWRLGRLRFRSRWDSRLRGILARANRRGSRSKEVGAH
jgi:hypothetical protein